MTIDERFGYFSINPVQDNFLVATAENRLIGPQVAIHSETPLAGGTLAVNLAGFLAHNRIELTSDFDGVVTSAGRDEAAIVGELGVEYLVAVTPVVAVRVGYQFLAAAGIGLATNDPNITRSGRDAGYPAPPAQIPASGITAQGSYLR